MVHASSAPWRLVYDDLLHEFNVAQARVGGGSGTTLDVGGSSALAGPVAQVDEGAAQQLLEEFRAAVKSAEAVVKSAEAALSGLVAAVPERRPQKRGPNPKESHLKL